MPTAGLLKRTGPICWYRDKACTAGPVTGLKILEELKERPVREAPYAPMDLYAKWETQES